MGNPDTIQSEWKEEFFFDDRANIQIQLFRGHQEMVYPLVGTPNRY